MDMSLNGLTVLVTRPGQSGRTLCDEIEAMGGEAIFYPTIAFASPDDANLCTTEMAQLRDQDWVIFNSPQAVASSVPFINQYFSVWPNHVQIAAIGGGTAKTLQQAGLPVSIQPEIWSSEGLLALPVFQSVKGKKIVIIRGAGGVTLLDQVLGSRGAHVRSIIAYKRVLPCPIEIAAYRLEKVTAVIATSCEGIENLKTLLGETRCERLYSQHLIVVSSRIKALAESLGFKTIWIASAPNHDAILAELLKLVHSKK